MVLSFLAGTGLNETNQHSTHDKVPAIDCWLPSLPPPMYMLIQLTIAESINGRSFTQNWLTAAIIASLWNNVGGKNNNEDIEYKLAHTKQHIFTIEMTSSFMYMYALWSTCALGSTCALVEHVCLGRTCVPWWSMCTLVEHVCLCGARVPWWREHCTIQSTYHTVLVITKLHVPVHVKDYIQEHETK